MFVTVCNAKGDAVYEINIYSVEMKWMGNNLNAMKMPIVIFSLYISTSINLHVFTCITSSIA